MQVHAIETSGLGDRSYIVTDGGVAVVVDPQRDIDRVLESVGDARITHVLETHIHNDYVTGGLELSRTVDAEYVVPAGEDLGYPARRIRDGDEIEQLEAVLEAWQQLAPSANPPSPRLCPQRRTALVDG